MPYRIELHRTHEIIDNAGKSTQRAIMAINDIARSKNLRVSVVVQVSPSANINDDCAYKFIDGSWMQIGRFVQPQKMPLAIINLYAIIRNIEDSYKGL